MYDRLEKKLYFFILILLRSKRLSYLRRECEQHYTSIIVNLLLEIMSPVKIFIF